MGKPWRREPHTAAKHEIYKSYLNAWFPILSTFEELTYAEGFAGHGIYLDGEPGSPIIALRSYLGRREELTRVRRVRFLLVDKEADQVDTLSRQVAKLLQQPEPVSEYDDGVLQVVVKRGRCEEILPNLLDRTRAWGKPILGVFDTFGGGVPATLLDRIAQNAASEVIYTLLPQHFARFHNQERGDAVFADDTWRTVADLEADQKRSFIAERFEETLGTYFQHVVRFDLGTSRGDLLNLWFGTQNRKGIAKFKDATWKADPVTGIGFYDPRDPNQQLLPMHHEPDLAPLRRILHRKLRSMPGRSQRIDQLRDWVALATVYKSSHVTPALTKMIERKLIERPESSVRLGTTVVTALAEPPNLFDQPG